MANKIDELTPIGASMGDIQIKSDDPAECGATRELIEQLPALPTPNYKVQRKQAAIGCSTVLFAICLLVSIVYGVSFNVGDVPDAVRLFFVILISLEAVAALSCLIGIMFGDPGVIKRKPDTCFPQPDEVTACLKINGSCEGMHNIWQGKDVSYCIRCYVWRQPAKGKVYSCRGFFPFVPSCTTGGSAHHCSICARCVQHFDHHCMFYGRCIGRGNMIYFLGCSSVGYLALATTICCVITCTVHKYT